MGSVPGQEQAALQLTGAALPWPNDLTSLLLGKRDLPAGRRGRLAGHVCLVAATPNDYLFCTRALQPAGHLCGIAAGVLQVYAARGLSWLWRRLRGGGRRRLAGGRVVGGGVAGPPPKLLDLGSDAHPSLGWMDLGSHLLLGVGTLLMAYLSARQRRGGPGGR